MPGLLGNGWDDPQSSANMALAAGLLRGDFGAGLLGANSAYQGAQEAAAKKQYMGMQMQNMQSEIDARKLQAQKLQGLLNMLNPQATAAAPAMPGQLGSGSFGIVPPPAGAPAIPAAAQGGTAGGSRIGSMSLDQVAAAKLLGADLTDVYKLAQPDMQVSNGYAYDKNSIRPGFLPGINIANDGRGTVTMPGADGMPRMAAMPGSVGAYRQFEDAKNDSAAGVKPIKIYNPATKRDEYRTEAEVTGRAPQLGAQPGVTGNFAGDPASVIASINTIKDPQERANALAAFNEQARRTPGFAGGAPFAAGQSTSEALSKEAGAKINESFLKTSYEPTLEAGKAANDTLTNVTVARNSMRAMGGTGWGTEAKAGAASVLAGLGVAPQNAKFYAANAETFQNVAMSNLKTQLDASKGPQTEGDADRGAKLFAQLKNTPQANEFILDMMEAKAQRDQMKAQFFQQALPIAQEKGDLAEVERAWSKRAPSVFSMPSMKKWNSK